MEFGNSELLPGDVNIELVTTYEVSMELEKMKRNYPSRNNLVEWQPENIIEIEKTILLSITEKICQNKQCRFPLLALRLLIHVITGIDQDGRIYICARQLAKTLDVHYDTVNKCLKHLREIGVLRIER